ncbi:hypothetical protein AMECASPLE_015074 [Ameca splendens]|uniref:Uncharacterized protein n=1 Tax=Ameca splendens TaxID=208324 RepID=A0ABV0YCV1_9TELE
MLPSIHLWIISIHILAQTYRTETLSQTELPSLSSQSDWMNILLNPCWKLLIAACPSQRLIKQTNQPETQIFVSAPPYNHSSLLLPDLMNPYDIGCPDVH